MRTLTGQLVRLFLLLAWLSCLLPALANAGAVPYEQIRFYRDPSGEQTLEQIQALPESQWAPPPKQLTLSRDTYWFHVRLNPSSLARKRFYLFGDYFSQEVDFHYRDPSGSWQHINSGSKVPPSQRKGSGRTFGFAFNPGENQSFETYVRVHSSFHFIPNFYLDDLDAFARGEQAFFAICGFLIGFLVFGITTMLLVGRSLLERKLYSYSAFGLTMIFAIVSFYGLWDLLVGPVFGHFGAYFVMTGTLMPVMGGLIFCEAFLDVRKTLPFAFIAIRVLMIASILTLFGRLLFPWNPAFEFLARIGINAVAGVLYVATGVVAYRKKVPYAGYYLAGWAIFMMGVVIFHYNVAGGGRLNTWSLLAPSLGQLVEMLILTYALILNFRSLRDAQAESRHLGMLLRVLSHDLAQPITMIQFGLENGMELSAAKSDGGEYAFFFKKIEKGLNSLNEMLKELRTLLTIRSGRAQLRLTAVGLGPVLRELQELFSERLRAKSLVLQHEGDWTEECRIWADPEPLVRSVLGNVLSNAIKFSRRGSTIRLIASDLGSSVEIRIEDQGVGIPEKELRKIFSDGTNASRPGTEGETGSGFGVLILRGYLEKFGASLAVESTEGQGTCVCLTFRKPG